MTKSLSAAFSALVLCAGLAAAAPAQADEGPSCASKAIDKNGKALAGAAKKSKIHKCCLSSAVSSSGKPLSGAAKKSYVTKCEAE